jgi:hypothetical protein
LPEPADFSDDRSLWDALLGDGRFLIATTGMALLASGIFAIAQSITGQLLPHDLHALGMDASALAHQASPNLVRFMFHDRVAFGGTLIAIGIAYWWLAEFALRCGAAWGWWTLALSGGCGFLSFLAYLGYGYLDTWHGVATLLLLPIYCGGMWRARRRVNGPLNVGSSWTTTYRPKTPAEAIGRKLLFLCGLGLIGAGATILVVGMTFVFVPQDVSFIGIPPDKLRALSPVLVPLLAHDRAGFGGGLFSVGVILVMMMRHAPMSRSLVQIVALMGLFGFGAALGVHFAIGYTDFRHLSPAYAGFLMFAGGTALLARGLFARHSLPGSPVKTEQEASAARGQKS